MNIPNISKYKVEEPSPNGYIYKTTLAAKAQRTLWKWRQKKM